MFFYIPIIPAKHKASQPTIARWGSTVKNKGVELKIFNSTNRRISEKSLVSQGNKTFKLFCFGLGDKGAEYNSQLPCDTRKIYKRYVNPEIQKRNMY